MNSADALPYENLAQDLDNTIKKLEHLRNAFNSRSPLRDHPGR